MRDGHLLNVRPRLRQVAEGALELGTHLVVEQLAEIRARHPKAQSPDGGSA